MENDIIKNKEIEKNTTIFSNSLLLKKTKRNYILSNIKKFNEFLGVEDIINQKL